MLAIGLAPEPFLAPSRPALSEVAAEYHERLASPPPTEIRLRGQVMMVEADDPEEASR